MKKITFRTGSSAYRARMEKDQELGEALFQHRYPEAYLSGAETAEAAKTIVTRAVRSSEVDVVSNSEIVLNEIRIAVKEGRLSPEDVKIVWYKEGEPGHEVREEIRLLPSGSVAALPVGFFDALENQYARLFGRPG